MSSDGGSREEPARTSGTALRTPSSWMSLLVSCTRRYSENDCSARMSLTYFISTTKANIRGATPLYHLQIGVIRTGVNGSNKL